MSGPVDLRGEASYGQSIRYRMEFQLRGIAVVTTRTGLPPGQRALDHFPRFGTHLNRPAPVVPEAPVLEIAVADAVTFSTPVSDLAALPRLRLTADFHCVSGWSATDLTWEGVGFATFFEEVVEPRLPPGVAVSHVLFAGLDGHESVLLIQDALAPDVIIADRLDDAELGADHGAPVRLVSPQQYGYLSCKHLCRIELLTAPPDRPLGAAHPVSQRALRGPLVVRHPRARVWEEERHTFLPARLLRPIYRSIYRRAFRLGLGGEPPRAR